jgi:hypothetical protein
MEDKAEKLEVETTDAPATQKRSRGRPWKLRVVAPATPEQNRQAEWKTLAREAKAEALGIRVEDLPEEIELVENWRDKLPKPKAPAHESFAGLYHLNGGNVWMNSGEVAQHGTVVRLNAEDGRHITIRSIGIRVGD